MAITLADYAKIQTDPLQKFVIMNILREVRVMEFLPFENVDALQSVAIRWQTLPDTDFRSINEGFTRSTGTHEQVWEGVYGFGGEFEFDRVFQKVKNTIVDPVQQQSEMKLMSMSLKFNEYFIDGDHATDEKGFEGLKKRVASMPTRQSVYFAGSTAAALDPTASVAAGNTFWTKIEEVHRFCNRGQVGAMFANEGMILGLGRVARYIQSQGGNFLDVTKDSFDREILTLKGAPVIDMGYKKDQTTEIIPDNETAGDAGTDATSIYAASFNIQQGLIGIQLSDLDFYDPLNGGEMETKPAKLRRLDWWVGLAGFGSYGVVRGRNVEGASNWT